MWHFIKKYILQPLFLISFGGMAYFNFEILFRGYSDVYKRQSKCCANQPSHYTLSQTRYSPPYRNSFGITFYSAENVAFAYSP